MPWQQNVFDEILHAHYESWQQEVRSRGTGAEQSSYQTTQNSRNEGASYAAPSSGFDSYKRKRQEEPGKDQG